MGIIRSCFSFILGTVSGIYVAQNYDVPNIKKLAHSALFMAKHVEEKYRKPKKGDDDWRQNSIRFNIIYSLQAEHENRRRFLCHQVLLIFKDHIASKERGKRPSKIGILFIEFVRTLRELWGKKRFWIVHLWCKKNMFCFLSIMVVSCEAFLSRN